jgi:transmembrane sensor
MTDQELKGILDRYKAGEATADERALLLSWSLDFNSPDKAELSMEEHVADVDLVWAALEKKLPQAKKISIWPKVLAAAVVLIILSLGIFFLRSRNSTSNQMIAAQIVPGSNKATLTLSNGKKVVLDGAAQQQLLTEAGLSITKTSDGQLIYTAVSAEGATKASRYNTLETSNGQQYQVVLPDGSHVWLNAASSLRYPVVFGKQERLVQLSGEGYFEVAHDKNKPFRVKTDDQLVEVLGTHFNINAYPDDQLSKTTLLKGRVRVSAPALKNKGVLILDPGQESILVGNTLLAQPADLEAAVAWRNGDFMFEGENIRSIMKKVSRWYNVEVIFEGDIPESRFGGTVSRFSNVTQVLRKLELTGKVHFKVEERRIIVTK